MVGIIFGLPSLRIKGFYLIMSTVAAYFIIHWLVLQFRGLTGGTEGLSVPPSRPLRLSLRAKTAYFYVVLVTGRAGHGRGQEHPAHPGRPGFCGHP